MNIHALNDQIRRAVRLSFTRSGGPGGQNVNRVQTKVRVRLPIAHLTLLSDGQKERIRSNLAARITPHDELVVVVDQERSQARNRAIAVNRLAALVAGALCERKPRHRNVAMRRAPRRARERRLACKRRRAEKKRLRGPVREWD